MVLQDALLKHTSYWLRMKLDCSYPSKGEHYKSCLQYPALDEYIIVVVLGL